MLDISAVSNLIKNLSKKRVLVSGARLMSSHLSQMIGLMFHKKLVDSVLIFEFSSEKRRSLHMLFVFQSIDLIFLDSKKRIVEVKEDFLPFTFYWPKLPSRYILECPAGTVRRSLSSVGDKIVF